MNTLILCMLNSGLYRKYGHKVKRILRSDEIKEVFAALEVLHDQAEVDLSLDDLILGLHRAYPEKKAEMLARFVDEWRKTIYDTNLTLQYIEEESRRSHAYDIALKAVSVSEGKSSYEELVSLVNRELPEPQAEEFEFVNHSLTSLQEVKDAQGGYRWPLNSLNRLIGPVPSGRLVWVFGRPNVGKSSFLATCIPYFSRQSSGPILVLANEEAAESVLTRYMMAYFKITEAELFTNKDKYQAHWDAKLAGKLIISGDPALLHKSNVERLLKRVKPSIVVFDQLPKIVGFKADRRDLELGAAAIWVRALAKEYNAMAIAVSQANAHAEGRRYLSYVDMADSSTSIAAEADLIIGLGQDEDQSDIRYVSILKDKLPLAGEKDPTMRHGRETLIIKPDCARYEDVYS